MIKNNSTESPNHDGHVGCFGNFDINDKICSKFCVLCLRCIIERDQNSRIEILEDIMASEEADIVFQ